MAQNEMKAMRGMPLRVRSMEGLGRILSVSVFGLNSARSGELLGWQGTRKGHAAIDPCCKRLFLSKCLR